MLFRSKYNGAISQLHENLDRYKLVHQCLVYYKERNRATREAEKARDGGCVSEKTTKTCGVQTSSVPLDENISGLVRTEVSEYLSEILDEKHFMTQRLSESVEYAITAVNECKDVLLDRAHRYFVLKLAFCRSEISVPGCSDDNGDIKYILSDTIRQKYIGSAEQRNRAVSNYLKGQTMCQPDAGFDLFVPQDSVSQYQSRTIVNYHIKCAMYFNGNPCGYYLFARSSTGTKTPLRLANSVGIIDAGYRGSCISVLDNKIGRAHV